MQRSGGVKKAVYRALVSEWYFCRGCSAEEKPKQRATGVKRATGQTSRSGVAATAGEQKHQRRDVAQAWGSMCAWEESKP